jgi:hypothetical protein
MIKKGHNAAFLTGIIAIIFVFTAGCTTIPGIGASPSDVPTGRGFTDITPRFSELSLFQERQKVSLEESLRALEVSLQEASIARTPYRIHYIKGEFLDIEGNADVWTIGLQSEDTTYFFFYTAETHQFLEWGGLLPDDPIDVTKIVNPPDLFKPRRMLLADLTNNGQIDIGELELREGIYLMIIDLETGMKSYYFDAITGLEIRQV